MKKVLFLMVAALFVVSSLAFAGNGSQPAKTAPEYGECPGCTSPDGGDEVSVEGAPNSGDGVPDGSGFDPNPGPSEGRGPAPNSGDGVSDGPGWEDSYTP